MHSSAQSCRHRTAKASPRCNICRMASSTDLYSQGCKHRPTELGLLQSPLAPEGDVTDPHSHGANNSLRSCAIVGGPLQLHHGDADNRCPCETMLPVNQKHYLQHENTPHVLLCMCAVYILVLNRQKEAAIVVSGYTFPFVRASPHRLRSCLPRL